MNAQSVCYLACGVNVEVGCFCQHTTEESNINAVVGVKDFLNILRNELLAVSVNNCLCQLVNLLVTQQNQVARNSAACFFVFLFLRLLQLNLCCLERLNDSRLSLLSIELGRKIQDTCHYLVSNQAGTYTQLRAVKVRLKIAANNGLPSLAGNTLTLNAAKESGFGAAGVVTVNVRRGQGLQGVDVDESSHDFFPSFRGNSYLVVLFAAARTGMSP